MLVLVLDLDSDFDLCLVIVTTLCFSPVVEEETWTEAAETNFDLQDSALEDFEALQDSLFAHSNRE